MRISSLYYKPQKDMETLKTLLIMGTSNFGATDEIIEVNEEADVVKLYGKEGTIYNTYKTISEEVVSQNVSVLIVKPYGSHSTATFNINTEHGIKEDALIFKSIYSNEIYNNINISINENSITFTFPINLNLEPKIYHYLDFPTLYLLMKRINEDTLNGKNIVFATSAIDEFTEFDESFFVINDSKKLQGGSSGLNLTNDEKFKELENTYQLLEGIPIDYICLTDVFYNSDVSLYYDNDRRCTFYEQALAFNINQLQFGIVTETFLAYNTENETYEESLKNIIDINYNICKNESLYKFRFLISIVYDFLYFNYKESLINPVVLIAFEMSKILTSGNITNKPLNKGISLNSNLTVNQIKEISNLSIMTFRHSPLYDSVVITNGMTNYRVDDDYKYLTTIVLLQNILPQIKEIISEQLGESIYQLDKNRVIDDAIVKFLNNKIKNGTLENYNFNIFYDTDKGHIQYELYIKNKYMIEGINYIGDITYEDLES